MATRIESEIADIATVFGRYTSAQKAAVEAIGKYLSLHPPQLIATIGRGSSDHAAQYIRTAFELSTGIPSMSIMPSIASVYGRQLYFQNTLAIAVSQSGRSPDICAAAEMAKKGGAFVVAIVNKVDSPLADVADIVLPIEAGEEQAVAATKSFAGTLAVALRLLAYVRSDPLLTNSIDKITEAWHGRTDVIDAFELILQSRSCMILGRGLSLGLAQEAALKIKEILQFPAEAFSSAEVLHGPVGLAAKNCSVLGWTCDPKTQSGQLETLNHFASLGSEVLDLQQFTTSKQKQDAHPFLIPLLPLPMFYRTLAKQAVVLGLDPDQPTNLRKVTETT